MIGEGLTATSIVRTSPTPEVISGNNVAAIFYVTGGWNHIADLSVSGLSGTITGIQFGYAIPAKSSIKNVAINNCLAGVKEVAGVFLTSIENVQAVNCGVGFDFSSSNDCTSLLLSNCYAANTGTAYTFKQVVYSNITACAADNCNWGTLPANPYGTGFGSPASGIGIYHFNECSGITLANCGSEGSYGNGVVSTISSVLHIDGLKAINCASTYVPTSVTEAVGPIQGTTAANTVVITAPSITGWTNAPALAAGNPVASLVAFNYDEAVFGATAGVQFFVSGATGSATSGLFKGPRAYRYCLASSSLKPFAARAVLGSSSISLSPYVQTIIPFDTETYDTNYLHGSGTFTVPVGGEGLYAINSRVFYRSGVSGSGDCGISIWVNGTDVADGKGGPPLGANGDIVCDISDTLYLNDGDTVNIRAFSVYGGSILNVAYWSRASFSKL